MYEFDKSAVSSHTRESNEILWLSSLRLKLSKAKMKIDGSAKKREKPHRYLNGWEIELQWLKMRGMHGERRWHVADLARGQPEK